MVRLTDPQHVRKSLAQVAGKELEWLQLRLAYRMETARRVHDVKACLSVVALSSCLAGFVPVLASLRVLCVIRRKLLYEECKSPAPSALDNLKLLIFLIIIIRLFRIHLSPG